MKTLNFILRQPASNGDTIVLWQRGHYTYEIERKTKAGMPVSSSQYLNTSCEQAKEIVDRMCK